MTTVLRTAKVTARKPHRCSCCSAVCIQPGDQYTRDSILNDGRVYDWVMCSDCADLFQTVWDWAGSPWDEGLGPDHYAEWANDLKGHDSRADAYLARAFGEVPA
jgi:hypothetical protein